MAHPRQIKLDDYMLDELARGLNQANGQSWIRLVHLPGNIWALEIESNPPFPIGAETLDIMAIWFWERREPPKDDNLNAAIECMSRSIDVTADGDIKLIARILDICEYYRYRYIQRTQVADLRGAVGMIERASAIITPSHQLYSNFLKIYALWALLDISLLPGAISLFHDSRTLLAEDLNLLQFYTNLLHRQYERHTTPEDLQTAIKVSEEIAVSPILSEASTLSQKIKLSALVSLAHFYGQLYESDPDSKYLDQAVERAHRASSILRELPSTAEDADVFGALAFAYRCRYMALGMPLDLDNAVLEGEKACQLAVDTDPSKAARLNNHAESYENLFERYGSMDDLERATGLMENSIKLTPNSGPAKARRLNNLANKLGRRFDWTNEMEYLDQSIQKLEEAAGSEQQSPFERGVYSQNLGLAYMQRFERKENSQDLRNSVNMIRKAINCYGQGSPSIAACYKLLGIGLVLLSETETTGREKDSTEAAQAFEMAVSLCPAGHPLRAIHLIAQGQFYANQFERHDFKNLDDMEKTIALIEEAVEAMPGDTPERGGALIILGRMLSMRFAMNKNPQDMDLSLNHYREAAALPNGYPLKRIKAARSAIRLLNGTDEWAEMNSLGEMALEILPLACGRYQRLDDQQEALLQTSGLAADVCSISLKMGLPEDALRKLEFGKGLVIGYMIDNHDDLKVLRGSEESGVDLAAKYESIKRRLYLSPDDLDLQITESKMRDRRAAARDMEECLKQIRQIKGNEYFLRGLPLDQMRRCGDEGPIVVVNVTAIDSSAILISKSRINAIVLPDIKIPDIPDFFSTNIRIFGYQQKTAAREGKLKIKSDSVRTSTNDEGSLEWLWRTCVSVVLDALKESEMITSTDLFPRIWWIGSGVASAFPFHAAASGKEGEDALSQMIPSYVPSFKTLLHSRQLSREYRKSGPEKQRVTVVTMAKTPGYDSLPGVTNESHAIKDACAESYNCRVLEQPDVWLVLQSIVDSDIMHFACHGSSDIKNPIQSHLMLQKSDENGAKIDKLTVSRILGVTGSHFAWISFLSACSTAETRGSALADEGLHISSALQLAGFVHVIGSIWVVDDEVSVYVASSFYKNLIKKGSLGLGNREVAEALRESVLEARKRYSEPWKWAAYIHSGA